MATARAGLSPSSAPQTLAKASESAKIQTLSFPCLNNPWRTMRSRSPRLLYYVRPLGAAPEKLSDKVAESVKNAEEACADNPESGECAAAWDEVEELSAAASHARDRKKETDALEKYCEDNPETDECRTYDN